MGILYRIIKRIIDIVLSVCLMLLSSPILLLLALLLRMTAGKPVIYRSRRLGKAKKEFIVYKFRTLVNGLKRKEHGLAEKVVVNRLTEFMRDSHLDEALQFINVIKGDMSLIGPRPLDVARYNYLRKQDHRWDRIFKARPGLTCLNQIARYTFWGMTKMRCMKGLANLRRRNRLLLDIYYVKNISFMLDLKIIYWTISYLFVGFFTKIFKKSDLNL